MAKINIVIPDDLLKQLRHAVIERYGGGKGGLSKAVTEAVQLWLEKEKALGKRK
jgi:metal-responsive CopG/Arc/MetJ family transcriptional regulator